MGNTNSTCSCISADDAWKAFGIELGILLAVMAGIALVIFAWMRLRVQWRSYWESGADFLRIRRTLRNQQAEPSDMERGEAGLAGENSQHHGPAPAST